MFKTIKTLASQPWNILILALHSGTFPYWSKMDSKYGSVHITELYMQLSVQYTFIILMQFLYVLFLAKTGVKPKALCTRQICLLDPLWHYSRSLQFLSSSNYSTCGASIRCCILLQMFNGFNINLWEKNNCVCKVRGTHRYAWAHGSLSTTKGYYLNQDWPLYKLHLWLQSDNASQRLQNVLLGCKWGDLLLWPCPDWVCLLMNITLNYLLCLSSICTILRVFIFPVVWASWHIHSCTAITTELEKHLIGAVTTFVP